MQVQEYQLVSITVAGFLVLSAIPRNVLVVDDAASSPRISATASSRKSRMKRVRTILQV